MSTTSCPLCGSRKAKRACPALGQTICPVCCATKRQTEINCPPSCAYLSSARAHPAAAIQRRQEKDLRFVLPLMLDLEETQYRLVVFFQSVVLRHASSALPPLNDLDVADGAGAVAATLETAGKGIIYEHRAASMPAQRLAEELGRAATELMRESGANQRSVERDIALALRRIEAGARTAATALEDDEPPVYLNVLGRLLSKSGGAELQLHVTDAGPKSRATGERRLIIPG
jgi:hypothetical protein